MQNSNQNFDELTKDQSFIKELLRYLVFWPYILLSILFCLVSAFIYLRYSNYEFQATSKIEIIDKAQDSEMALPTSMTIFNRSMINLENEMGVLNSYDIHEKAVRTLESNVLFYSIGTIKDTKDSPTEWLKDYDFNLKVDIDSIEISSQYEIFLDDNKMSIVVNGKTNSIYNFDSLSTLDNENDLPFDLTIRDKSFNTFHKRIVIKPIKTVVENQIFNFSVLPSSMDSDQLTLSIIDENKRLALDYLNTLMQLFDLDGITDRQLEYKRTMDFVDSRSKFLKVELQEIENRRQDFKEKNKLSDIKSDATLNLNQKINYDNNLFQVKSQKDLLIMLKDLINNKDKFKLLPVNIGIEDPALNGLIANLNLVINERERYFLGGLGQNNMYIKGLEKQITDLYKNIESSINSYSKNLTKQIENLESKEEEYANFYNDVPEIEKILRSIERELEVKESLFLLLLQKREEAAINFAVVKPSIKIIDYARVNNIPVSPKTQAIYLLSLTVGLFFPLVILFVWFSLDNKIHTKEQLKSKIIDDIPIIGEVPFISDKSFNIQKNIVDNYSRNPLAESMRMINANLNFIFSTNKNKNDKKTLLVTSSIKGEGKTLVSINLASIFSESSKTLLVGADLRNPQLHKFLDKSKTNKGLADFIFSEGLDWKDFIFKKNKLDILLSGTIPPNPTQLLGSEKFLEFLNDAKNNYDTILIDSAPCLLVSDTYEISELVDYTVYMVRANHSNLNLTPFINDNLTLKRLKNINIVLNGVGSSQSYGYKYGYQYGYQYGYKYSYNYGYGYGYTEDK